LIGQLLYLLSLIIPFAAGCFLAGRVRFLSERFGERATAAAFYALILTLGFRIGRNGELLRDLQSIGLIALAFGLSNIAGTLAVLYPVYALIRALLKRAGRHPAAGDGRPHTAGVDRGGLLRKVATVLKDPLILAVLVAAGILAGVFIRAFPEADGEPVVSWLLYALLLFIGVSFAHKHIPLAQVLRRPDLLVLPGGTLVGSLLGGLALSFLLPVSAGKALAVSSGVGWYSLSAIILTDLDGPYLGTIALLSNLMREMTALLFIPTVARGPLPTVAIGMGGATSMDVTLPVIDRSLGPRAVPLALISGALLSLAVPVLVPLFYHLG